MIENDTHYSNKSAPSPAVELMWSEVIENGTHQYTWKAGKQVPNDMWSGKQVAAEPPPVSSNGKPQFNAGVALGWIGGSNAYRWNHHANCLIQRHSGRPPRVQPKRGGDPISNAYRAGRNGLWQPAHPHRLNRSNRVVGSEGERQVMNTKRSAIIVLAIATVGLLAGCGGGTSPAADTPQSQAYKYGTLNWALLIRRGPWARCF